MIGMDEENWIKKGGKAFFMQPALMCLCSFNFGGKDE